MWSSLAIFAGLAMAIYGAKMEQLEFVIGSGCLVLMLLLCGVNGYWRKRIIIFGLVAIALALKTSSLHVYEEQLSGLFARKVVVEGVVNRQPKMSEFSTSLFVEELCCDGQGGEWPGQLRVTLPLYQPVSYGDKIKLTGKVLSVDSVEDKGYRLYLENKRVVGLMTWPEVVVVDSDQGNSFVAWGIKIQQWAVSRVQRLLPQDEGAFMLGVVLGAEQMISEEFSESLKRTGTTHIVVASGYNVSVVLMMVWRLAYIFRRSWLNLIAIISVVGYLLISGLDPSITRAAVLGILGVTAVQVGRQKSVPYLLLLVAAGMLLVNPWWLFDISFQLSFAATAGLLLFAEPLSVNLQRLLPGWVVEPLATTLAAQVLVIPVLLSSFGSLSVVSLLTNVLVLWVTPMVMLGGVLVLLLAVISMPLAGVMAWLVYPMIWYIKWVVSLTSKLPGALIEFDLPLVAIVGCCVVALLLFVTIKYLYHSYFYTDNYLSKDEY